MVSLVLVSVGDAVEQFKQFMILQPYNRVADMPVMKGLLVKCR